MNSPVARGVSDDTRTEPVRPDNILLIRMHEDAGGCPATLFCLQGCSDRAVEKLSGHFINDYVLVRADLGKQRSAVQMVH